MPFVMHCPACGRRLQVPSKIAGSRFDCPKCRQSVVAPARGLAVPARAPAGPSLPADLGPQAGPPAPGQRGRRPWALLLAGGMPLLGLLGVLAWLATREVPSDTTAANPSGPAVDLRPVQWQLEYDQGGRPTRLVDPAGRETRVEYELNARGGVRKRIKIRADGSRVTCEFDEFGRRARMADALGVVEYGHDGFGRLTSVARRGRPAIKYAYDTLNRLTAVEVGEKHRVGYAYDFLGRVEKIETPAGPITFVYHGGKGLVERRLPNGVRTVWKYRPDARLDSLTHTGADGRPLLGFVYAYRPDGLIGGVEESSAAGVRKVAYEYDRAHRLVGVDDSRRGKMTYRYDDYGNRLEVTEGNRAPVAAAHDWAGRLLRHDGRACAHDAAGNLTEYTRAPGRVAVSHNVDGLPASARTDSAAVQYRHDGDGNLASRSSGDTETSFLPDPSADIWRPLLSVAPGGKHTLYVWDGGRPLAAISDDGARFFLSDHLGSVRALVGGDGRVAAEADYSPFGVPSKRFAEGGLWPGFTGLFYDPDAALYLARARAYDPALGRFLERDPETPLLVSSPRDLSAYAYCGNDPINHDDLTGCQANVPPALQPRPPDLMVDNVLRQVRLDDQLRRQAQAQEGFQHRLRLDEQLRRQAQAQDTLRQQRDMQDRLRLQSQALQDSLMRQVQLQGQLQRQATRAAQTGPDLNALLQASRRASNLPVAGAAANVKATQDVLRQILPATRAAALALPAAGPPRAAVMPSLAPSRVGGIALGGAARALPDLGRLKGVAVDANGRLVLITEGKGEVGLPPLRLDDLATVFRCVYQRGESPWVTIDPDSVKRPPLADVRNDPGTADTYVGWILYEADRIMKCYSLGVDSYTRQEIKTAIPGHAAMLDARYALAGQDSESNRYWIVPSAVRRRRSADRRLTLLDVPLRLDTERSVIRDGKKVVLKGTQSKAALAYCTWFTEHYADLAKEVYLKPPPESGITEPVAVFAEVQRIALIVALAEALRDQGVPMPAWMAEHTVTPVPVPKKTPHLALENQRTVNGTVYRLSQYGGVTLSPPAAAIREVVAAPEAEGLSAPVRQAAAAAPSLTPTAFQHEGRDYQLVALPGGDTRAVGACRLEEVDLEIPLQGAARLTLARQFHSFFRPDEGFGPGWALDLPRLEQVRPSGGKHVYFRLTSALSAWNETFRETRLVEEVKAKLIVPDAGGEILGLGVSRRLGFETDLVLFRDGRGWHFTPDGKLAAVEDGGLSLRYHYEGERKRLSAIEATQGDKRAEIRLAYDARGRISETRGSDGAVVSYAYDDGGRLLRCQKPSGITGYRYQDGLLSAVLRDGKAARAFEYAAGGRLLREKGGAGPEVTYGVKPRPGGGHIITATARGQAPLSAEYDAAFRPVRQALSDGTRLDWSYLGDGTTEMTATGARGESVRVTRSADGRRETVRLPQGGRYEIRRDASGRTLEVVQDGRPALRQRWHPNGQLAALETETTALRPEPSPDGQVKRLLLTPPDELKGITHWVDIRYDDAGRPRQVTDHSGARIAVRYEPSGAVKELTVNGQKMEVRRDDKGRVQELATAWGERTEYGYAPAGGQLASTRVTRGDSKAALDYEGGRVTKVRQFDGGEVSVRYYSDGARKGQPMEIRTPTGLLLKYAHDPARRTTTADCGEAFCLEYQYDERGRLVRLAQVPGRSAARVRAP